MNKKLAIMCAFLVLLGVSSSSGARHSGRRFSGGRGGHYGYTGHRGYHHGRGYRNGRWGALAVPAIIGGAVATAVEAGEAATHPRVYDNYDYDDDDVYTDDYVIED